MATFTAQYENKKISFVVAQEDYSAVYESKFYRNKDMHFTIYLFIFFFQFLIFFIFLFHPFEHYDNIDSTRVGYYYSSIFRVN